MGMKSAMEARFKDRPGFKIVPVPKDMIPTPESLENLGRRIVAHMRDYQRGVIPREEGRRPIPIDYERLESYIDSKVKYYIERNGQSENNPNDESRRPISIDYEELESYIDRILDDYMKGRNGQSENDPSEEKETDR